MEQASHNSQISRVFSVVYLLKCNVLQCNFFFWFIVQCSAG
uniref:Uncharacterized protein n=1 Tax=Anguilla anguilla TaxID=7936 RepID=A0A0E9QR01_ANGAN